MKVAIVHDFLNQWGGGEETLKNLVEMYPDAPIYTIFHDYPSSNSVEYELLQKNFPQEKLKTSWIQRIPKWFRGRHLFWLYPLAVESFDFTKYDLVISDTSSYAKGIITAPGTKHICYIHTPTRYLWDWHEQYLQENNFNIIKKIILKPILSYLRIWDYWAADRVDHFIANSYNVQKRVKKYYKKEADVIYPPVEVIKKHDHQTTKKISSQDYYLIISRLSAYKKIDLAIKACNKLNKKLIIAGSGRDEKQLKQIAQPNITFMGKVSHQKKQELYQNCKAFIMPTYEDFGITTVEALSYQKPVIAYKKGGSLEIIEPGINGEFFSSQKVESLIETIELFERKQKINSYDPHKIYLSATRFDRTIFKQKMQKIIKKVMEQ